MTSDADPTVARVEQYLRQADAGVLEFLGIEIVALAAEQATLALRVATHMVNSRGICHGGVLFALADSALIYALVSGDRSAVTLSAGIDYLRPARHGDTVTAQARVVSQTRRTALCEASLLNQQGELLARARATAFKHDTPLLPAG